MSRHIRGEGDEGDEGDEYVIDEEEDDPLNPGPESSSDDEASYNVDDADDDDDDDVSLESEKLDIRVGGAATSTPLKIQGGRGGKKRRRPSAPPSASTGKGAAGKGKGHKKGGRAKATGDKGADGEHEQRVKRGKRTRRGDSTAADEDVMNAAVSKEEAVVEMNVPHDLELLLYYENSTRQDETVIVAQPHRRFIMTAARRIYVPNPPSLHARHICHTFLQQSSLVEAASIRERASSYLHDEVGFTDQLLDAACGDDSEKVWLLYEVAQFSRLICLKILYEEAVHMIASRITTFMTKYCTSAEVGRCEDPAAELAISLAGRALTPPGLKAVSMPVDFAADVSTPVRQSKPGRPPRKHAATPGSTTPAAQVASTSIGAPNV